MEDNIQIILNDDGTITFKEKEKKELPSIDLKYEDSEIPKEFIDKCELLSEETGETYFIFDTLISNRISKIELEDTYHIGTGLDFIGLPSRFSYYDTETKIVDRYKKYDYVTDFIKKLGFIPTTNNLGFEYEQSYTYEFSDGDGFEKFIIRLQPNLFLKILYQSSEKYDTVFNGFFNKLKINNIIKTFASDAMIRDSKLSQIL